MATGYASRKSASCKTCGKKARPSSFLKYRGGDCKACFQKRKDQERTDLLAKPCKVCGKAIGTNDKRQVVCSRNCAFQNLRKGRIEVKCCNCGKSVFRYEAALKIRSVFSCSLKCQRQYALVENHSTASKVDWLSKSAKAKRNWKASDSKRRRLCNPWMRKIRSKLDKCKASKVDTEGWEYRIAVRLNAAIGRETRKQINPPHSRTIEQAIRKIRQKRKLFELSEWEKKIGWKLSSHKARRSRKRNAQKQRQVEGFGHPLQNQGKWIQVCFEWVGD